MLRVSLRSKRTIKINFRQTLRIILIIFQTNFCKIIILLQYVLILYDNLFLKRKKIFISKYIA